MSKIASLLSVSGTLALAIGGEDALRLTTEGTIGEAITFLEQLHLGQIPIGFKTSSFEEYEIIEIEGDRAFRIEYETLITNSGATVRIVYSVCILSTTCKIFLVGELSNSRHPRMISDNAYCSDSKKFIETRPYIITKENFLEGNPSAKEENMIEKAETEPERRKRLLAKLDRYLSRYTGIQFDQSHNKFTIIIMPKISFEGDDAANAADVSDDAVDAVDTVGDAVDAADAAGDAADTAYAAGDAAKLNLSITGPLCKEYLLRYITQQILVCASKEEREAERKAAREANAGVGSQKTDYAFGNEGLSLFDGNDNECGDY